MLSKVSQPPAAHSQSCLLPFSLQLLDIMKTLRFTLDNQSFQMNQFHSTNQGYDVMFWSWQKNSLQYISVGDYQGSLSIDTSQIRFHTLDNTVKSEGRGAANHNTVTKLHLPTHPACLLWPLRTLWLQQFFLLPNRPQLCELKESPP